MDETSKKERQKISVPKPVSYLREVINSDDKTKHDKLDGLITRIFPYFVVGCLVLILILIAYLRDFTFAGIIFAICLGFVIGFIVLGIACVFLSDTGIITGKYTVPVILIVPAAIALLFYTFGSSFGPNDFIMKFFNIFGEGDGLMSMLISIYSITLMIFFVAYGVVSVIVGYFRAYFYKVLIALEYPSEKRKNRIPEWLFQIPDIIDVHSVEVEPEEKEGFNKELFRNIAFSLFLLGVVICSYIFINPLFLQVMSFEEMLLIGVFLSFFITPLVIPWSIVRSIGAKVKSDAPRDFYLWKGMRGRMYQGFFAITFFMMLLTLSVYLGMDFSRIITTYLGYIIFMGIISMITSFVYVNTYYKGFKNGIVKSFLRAKEER